MKGTAQMAQLEMMMIDAFLSDNGEAIKASGSCIDGGTYTTPFTIQMRNALKAAFEDMGMEATDSEQIITEMENSGEFPKVGDSISSPAMQYLSSPTGYDHELKYGYSDTFNATVTCSSFTDGLKDVLRWTNDKNKLQYGFHEVYEGEGAVGGGYELIGQFSVDFEAKTMTYKNNFQMSDDMMGGNMIMDEIISMKECGANKCVNVKMTDKMESDMMSFKYEVEGKADDNGGYVQTTMIEDDGFSASTIYYKEYFNGDGNLVGVKESTDGENYTNYVGYGDYDYESNTYDDDGSYDVGLTDVNICSILSFSSKGTSVTCSTECYFDIYPSGISDPATQPEMMIGAGEVAGGRASVDYWGDPSLANATDSSVWVAIDYDTDTGFPVYEEAAGASITTAASCP